MNKNTNIPTNHPWSEKPEDLWNVIPGISETRIRVEQVIADSRRARENSQFSEYADREMEVHENQSQEPSMIIDDLKYNRERFLGKYPECQILLNGHKERWNDFVRIAENTKEYADAFFRYAIPAITPFLRKFPDQWDDAMNLCSFDWNDAVWICIDWIPWVFPFVREYGNAWDDIVKVAQKNQRKVSDIFLAFSAAAPYITSENYSNWMSLFEKIADTHSSVRIVSRLSEIDTAEDVQNTIDYFLLKEQEYLIDAIQKLLIAKDSWFMDKLWQTDGTRIDSPLSSYDKAFDSHVRESFNIRGERMEEKIKRWEFREAFAMSMNPSYNKEQFKDILTHYLNDDTEYIKHLSGNERWMNELWLSEKMNAWLARHERIVPVQEIWLDTDGKVIDRIKIYKETDPVRVLMMGNWLDGSCLTYWSINSCYWSAAINALDVNKAVFYIEDAHWRIIGCVPVAIDDDGNIVRFLLYTKGNVSRNLNAYFNEYIKDLAARCDLGINGDMEKIQRLNGEAWHENPVRLIK